MDGKKTSSTSRHAARRRGKNNRSPGRSSSDSVPGTTLFGAILDDLDDACFRKFYRLRTTWFEKNFGDRSEFRPNMFADLMTVLPQGHADWFIPQAVDLAVTESGDLLLNSIILLADLCRVATSKRKLLPAQLEDCLGVLYDRVSLLPHSTTLEENWTVIVSFYVDVCSSNADRVPLYTREELELTSPKKKQPSPQKQLVQNDCSARVSQPLVNVMSFRVDKQDDTELAEPPRKTVTTAVADQVKESVELSREETQDEIFDDRFDGKEWYDFPGRAALQHFCSSLVSGEWVPSGEWIPSFKNPAGWIMDRLEWCTQAVSQKLETLDTYVWDEDLVEDGGDELDSSAGEMIDCGDWVVEFDDEGVFQEELDNDGALLEELNENGVSQVDVDDDTVFERADILDEVFMESDSLDNLFKELERGEILEQDDDGLLDVDSSETEEMAVMYLEQEPPADAGENQVAESAVSADEFAVVLPFKQDCWEKTFMKPKYRSPGAGSTSDRKKTARVARGKRIARGKQIAGGKKTKTFFTALWKKWTSKRADEKKRSSGHLRKHQLAGERRVWTERRPKDKLGRSMKKTWDSARKHHPFKVAILTFIGIILFTYGVLGINPGVSGVVLIVFLVAVWTAALFVEKSGSLNKAWENPSANRR